jgi:hypothetical protein
MAQETGQLHDRVAPVEPPITVPPFVSLAQHEEQVAARAMDGLQAQIQRDIALQRVVLRERVQEQAVNVPERTAPPLQPARRSPPPSRAACPPGR